MKISDIKNKELRELADLRRNEYNYGSKEDLLIAAFNWIETKEGLQFWGGVNSGFITELPNDKNSDSEEEPKTKPCDLDFMVQELTLIRDRNESLKQALIDCRQAMLDTGRFNKNSIQIISIDLELSKK